MHKRYMERIAVVIHTLKEIAWPHLYGKNFQHAFHFKMQKPWQRRRFALAQISEDESQIFFSRVMANTNLFGKGFAVGRLLHALTATVVKPTVVHAPDTVSFDPTGGQLGSAMRAAKLHQMRSTACPPVEREILTHNSDGL